MEKLNKILGIFQVPDHDYSFKTISNVANHDEAIRSVIEGTTDVAPVSSINLELMITNGTINTKDFRIIHQSPNIPGAPLVYLRNLEPNLKEQIKSLVIDAHNHIDVYLFLVLICAKIGENL